MGCTRNRCQNPTLYLFLAAIGLAACSEGEPRPGVVLDHPATDIVDVPLAEPPLSLPISLNAVMVGLINHSSDPIFYAGNRVPQTDEEWRDLEYHAYQMVVGSKVIQMAGTGPFDAIWVSEPEWKELAEQMGTVGMEALEATQARDSTNFFEIGSQLVTVCEACHAVYKPDIPSMGIMHPPDFPREIPN